jgi:hypothetical protein
MERKVANAGGVEKYGSDALRGRARRDDGRCGITPDGATLNLQAATLGTQRLLAEFSTKYRPKDNS